MTSRYAKRTKVTWRPEALRKSMYVPKEIPEKKLRGFIIPSSTPTINRAPEVDAYLAQGPWWFPVAETCTRT